jgi:hypothetical protein
MLKHRLVDGKRLQPIEVAVSELCSDIDGVQGETD